MASIGDYKLLLNKWLNKTHTIGSPELDALINIESNTDGVVTTAFGEAAVVQNVPIMQITAQYSLLAGTLTVIDNNTSGTAFTEDSLFQAETGTDPDGLAAILTSKQLAYRAGQGALARISAVFDTPTADHIQGAGLINAEDSFAFGSVNDVFGVTHYHDGVVEAQELTITSAATGTENATITLNDIAYTVPLSSSSIEVNAWEIAQALSAQDSVHRSTSNGDTVYVISIISEPGGVYSFSSPSAVASFTQKTAGSIPIKTIVPQALWNIDTMPSLDILKLNDYQIQYNGVIEFSIQNAMSGMMDLVHRIPWTNNNVLPSASNPIFRVGWITQNKGNTVNKSIKGSFASAFIEGFPITDTPPRSITADATSIGTALTSLIIFRNRTHFNNKINRITTLLKFLSFATQANKPAFFELIINPVFDSPVDFEYADKANSVIELSTENIGVSGGTVVSAITVIDSAIIDTSNNVLTNVAPNTIFCIAARVSSGSAGDMQAAVTYQEDF